MYMELYLLLITFLIWFSSWNFIDSIMKHFKLTNESIMKVSLVGVVVVAFTTLIKMIMILMNDLLVYLSYNFYHHISYIN